MDENNIRGAAPADKAGIIGAEQVRKLTTILQKYKAGKARTEQRIIASENWWKLRNGMEERKDSKTMQVSSFKSQSGWLHNVIVSKHADAMEAYPEPNILPREADDKSEAKRLSAILPCIMENNDFEDTYSDVEWQKGKTGTGVYKVMWDQSKLNGLGDISIQQINILNLYWEPGVRDIQKSRYLFHTELMDKDLLQEQYPQLEGKLDGQSLITSTFHFDDSVSTDGKVTVVECYYHKVMNGKNTLQYVKYVNDQVLYATENDTAVPTKPGVVGVDGMGQPVIGEVPDGLPMAQRGLYDHGLYPYVFDVLFPIEGSPCGYGYVDICRSPQMTIDMLNTSFVKNAMAGSTPRFFIRADGSVNEEEFLDTTKPSVKVNGNLGEDSIRDIPFHPLDGVYVNLLDRTIQELRETSGNTETATGAAPAGVTAASAIAALQEASGKGSRDSNLASYRAFTKVVNMVIELIRQFYSMPRQFRIIGNLGAEEFISYDNSNLQPQAQGNAFGVDLGLRLPVFDIKISAQKKNVYTRVSNNELALQFFQLGFFNPQMVDQALATIEMMDFDGKDELMQKIARNGTMFQKLVQYMQLALQLAATAAPDMVQGLSNDIMQTMGVAPAAMGGAAAPVKLQESDNMSGVKGKENTLVTHARERSLNSTQPEGGRVTGEARG